MTGHRKHRQIPQWLIIAIGAAVGIAALIWSFGLHDDTGDALIDKDTAPILIALFTATGTILGLVLQRTRAVEHEVKPNSGSSMRDSTNRTEQKVDALVDAVAHLERAHRQQGIDIVQLREDQQQTRADLSGQASDIRGIRKDIGHVADAITKGTTS
ncbi:conserved hypothetical protein [Microbacterium sp. 8M]|uniref:hypothetical protein n=1 Tax=Microbacterium sp. 8M TaxID=2653153 RepID=UPI0012F0DA47|nr:hypothetical protein [Microbacterium sp. 8M]VXC32302.1 conserved hypothetical protein [Microbacterium sp. 8M]